MRILRFVLIAAICFLANDVYAQLLTNISSVPHAADDNSKILEVTTDPYGNSFSVIEFEGTVYLGTDSFVSQSPFRDDYLIVKRNFNESYQWARLITSSFDHSCGSLDTDSSGNVYFTGNFYGPFTMQIDSGVSGMHTISNINNFNNAFIGKFDAGGNLEWVRVIEGQNNTNNTSQPGFSKLRINGNSIFLTGVNYGPIDYDPSAATNIFTTSGQGVICSYTLNGDLIWAYPLGTVHAWLDYFGFTASNEIVIAGSFVGSNTDFDPGPQWQPYSSQGRDIFVVKLSANGLLQWARVYVNFGDQTLTGFTLVGSNSFMITGTTNATADLDPSAATFIINCPSGIQQFMARYDMVAGDFVSGTAMPQALSTLQLEWTGTHFVVFGFNTNGEYSLTFFDNAHNLLYYRQYGGPSPGVNAVRTHYRAPYTLYINGQASGTNNYGNDGSQQNVYWTSDSLTGVVVKYYLGWGPESVSELQSEDELNVYPNPANESVEVMMAGEKSTLFMYAMDGTLVWSETNIAAPRYTLNTSACAAGVYFLKCESDERVSMTKLVIAH